MAFDRLRRRRRLERANFPSPILPQYSTKKSKPVMDLKLVSSSSKSSTGALEIIEWIDQKMDGKVMNVFRLRSGREKKRFFFFFIKNLIGWEVLKGVF